MSGANRTYGEPAPDPWDARRANITRRREAGESFRSIGDSHGISKQRVKQLCDQWDVEPPEWKRLPDRSGVSV